MRWFLLLCVSCWVVACSQPQTSQEIPTSSEQQSQNDAAEGNDAGATEPSASQETTKEELPDSSEPAPEQSEPESEAPKEIAALTFSAPTKWAAPIEDYIAVGKKKKPDMNFLRGIHDMVVYLDRLYIGYGDANINLGRDTPIAFRYFPSPDETKVVSEFNSDEEQLDRYRILGTSLFMAGIDATEDAWLGNVYIKEGKEKWLKSRTLQGGVHVHDCVLYQDKPFCVGSGAKQAEWKQGKIFAHLWSSDDKGKSFQIVHRRQNPNRGDARWVRLLPQAKWLFVFGYQTNAQGQINSLNNSVYDGKTVTPIQSGSLLLSQVLVSETDIISPTLGLLRGVNVVKTPLRNVFLRMQDGKNPVPIEEFKDQTVLDIFTHKASGESIILSHDNSLYNDVRNLKSWDVHVWRTEQFKHFTKMMSFTTQRPPKSIAYWKGSLYFGDQWGEVWRSTGK